MMVKSESLLTIELAGCNDVILYHQIIAYILSFCVTNWRSEAAVIWCSSFWTELEFNYPSRRNSLHPLGDRRFLNRFFSPSGVAIFNRGLIVPATTYLPSALCGILVRSLFLLEQCLPTIVKSHPFWENSTRGRRM